MPKRDTAQGHESMAPPDDAIAMLKVEHRKVRTLFRQYDETTDQDKQQRIAEEVFAELDLHIQLEDTVFYPAFADVEGDEGERLAGGARQEHQLFKDLMAELRQIDDEMFPVRFHELRHHVELHMDEEEHEIFSQAAEHLTEKMAQMTDAMQKLKHRREAA